MDKISLAGLDKAKVLMALYDSSRPLGMGFLHYTPEPLDKRAACKALAAGTYFDYLNGRVMKVDLGGDELDPCLYDRDNGEGAALKAIEKVRKEEK